MTYETEHEAKPETKYWWKNWRVMVLLWVAMIGLTWLAVDQNVNTGVIAGSVVVVGLITNAFAWLLGIIALVPLIGPLIVKILSISFISRNEAPAAGAMTFMPAISFLWEAPDARQGGGHDLVRCRERRQGRVR